VFDNVPPTELALPRLGAVSLAVLGAAFEVKGVGGESPLESWVKRHLPKGVEMVTFASLKHRDEVERAEEQKRAKARKHARRDTAHRLRVERFTQRQGAA
jgi:hypothetical protein